VQYHICPSRPVRRPTTLPTNVRNPAVFAKETQAEGVSIPIGATRVHLCPAFAGNDPNLINTHAVLQGVGVTYPIHDRLIPRPAACAHRTQQVGYDCCSVPENLINFHAPTHDILIAISWQCCVKILGACLLFYQSLNWRLPAEPGRPIADPTAVSSIP
jgi:hypothetical protein